MCACTQRRRHLCRSIELSHMALVIIQTQAVAGLVLAAGYGEYGRRIKAARQQHNSTPHASLSLRFCRALTVTRKVEPGTTRFRRNAVDKSL